MNEDPFEFRRRRLEAGLSQTELASKIGVGRSRICDVEKARPGRGLAPQHLEAAAKVLGCGVHDLLLPDEREPAGVIQTVRAAMSQPCPACGAEPNRACLTGAGQQMPGVHRARARAAERSDRERQTDVS
ncbi:helix-turn-helix transcriptional regulator [Streptomyces sp. G1]|uniref:helix-turn-helix transcriptional regulator n=1 Tax=Streptomyces sp. G1 TaxID=361572 RepID=UPI00202FC4DC|nr:helix-turn-helix transcriptional regulator [Streptomyces sp. G1]MCM1977196.1 helix-turn-helix transcriptional regulator [Streptomyces sp. G1]